jgi:hypothetical protein
MCMVNLRKNLLKYAFMAERLSNRSKSQSNPGEYLRNRGRDFYAMFQEAVLTENPTEYPVQFNERIKQHENGLFIYVASHKSHPAGVKHAEVAEETRLIANQNRSTEDAITGSILIVASSLENGEQAEEIYGYWERAKPILHSLNVDIFPVLRRKEAEGLPQDMREAAIREQNTRLMQKITQRKSPILLVEGTVQSGRKKPGGKPGEIDGMVHVQQDAIAWIANSIRRSRQEPVFVPIGTTGENRIYDPHRERVPFSTKVTAVARSIPLLREHVPPLMHGVVGYPISYTEIVDRLRDKGVTNKQIPEMLDLTIGELIGQLNPPHERGVYSHPHLLPVLGIPYYTYEEAYAA